ncbi:MAG TPA: sulfotransferase domain-containing protein [Dongiaceae bacterium]|nr:sulfotransferase domain-containing protein [Dongiaceae bacterium]
MARIVWVASYPKSGNTWLRFLLANLILGKRVDSSAKVQLLVPDIHDGITGAHLMPGLTTLIKTHWAWNSAFPLREDTAGVIHLVRHPVDTLESNQNYAINRSGELTRRKSPEELQAFASNFVEEFIRDGGHRQFQQFGIGSLEQHFASWASPVIAFPKLLVRYEQLKAAPERELKRISHFIKLKRTEEQVALAVRHAAEREMRKLEEAEIAAKQHGIFYQDRNRSAIEAGHRFVGRSETGDSKYRLTPQQRDRATQRFSALIRQMGYDSAR